MNALPSAAARLLGRGLARCLVAGFALLGANAHAELSPELMSILNEVQGKLVVDFATDPRSRTDCQKEVINIARAAMNRRNISSVAEKSGQILIAALEHTCKFYLDAAGLGAISTTYSVAKCFYEYLDDASNDAGFIACLVGEAFGAGVGKAGEHYNVEELRQAIAGRVTDASVDKIKGEIASRREDISGPETDFSEHTIGDGCKVQLNIVWRKARNPVREQRTKGNAGTVTVTVGIRDCLCSLNRPYSQQLKNGSLVITLPVNFVRTEGSQPAWQADFPRMRTRLQAQCCSGAYSVLADPPRSEPKDPPVTTGTGTGVRPGTGGAGRPGGTPTGGTTPVPPPRPKPPPATPRPPVEAPKPVPMAEACPECVPLAAAVERAVTELERLRGKRPGLEDEIERHRRAAEDARNRIRSLEKFMQASKGQGGSSYDPETGITVSSYAGGDGTVTVTTTAADGTVLEQHTRDQASYQDAVKQVREEREREAAEQLAETSAREKLAQLEVAIARADDAIAAALRALEECLEACKRKGILFEEPQLRLPDHSPQAAPARKKPKPGTRKGPGAGSVQPRLDPPTVPHCPACAPAAAVFDHARIVQRRIEAEIESARAQMHSLTGAFIDGKLKPTAADSGKFGELKNRLRALERALETATAEVARTGAALQACHERCAAEPPRQSPTGIGSPWTAPPGWDGAAHYRKVKEALPYPPFARCERCSRLADDALNARNAVAIDRALLDIVEEQLRYYNALALGGSPPATVPTMVSGDDFRAMSATQRATFLAELQRDFDRRQAEYQDALDEMDAAYQRVEECNSQCASSVTVDKVVNRTGTNPFDPANPAGGGATGTQPPPQQPPPENPRGALRFASPTYSGTEGGSVVLTVERASGTAGVVGVSYQAAAGTATAGTDFAPASGSLTWSDGDAAPRTISIALPDDSQAEQTETFTVSLGQPSGGALLASPSIATVSIADNDSAPPPQTGALQFSLPGYETAESASAVTITVLRNGGSAGAASVQYATASGSAAAGLDFQAVSGTLSWATGDSSPRTFTVPIINDTLVESTETFQVLLSAPSGATLGAPGAATVSIQDNDVASGPCGPAGSPWVANAGSSYVCSGNCNPCPSPQTITVSGDRVTVSPFHAGGAATFTGCGTTLNSDSSTLTYFGQSNHRATITRTSNNAFNASIVSSGGGSCAMSCFRVGP